MRKEIDLIYFLSALIAGVFTLVEPAQLRRTSLELRDLWQFGAPNDISTAALLTSLEALANGVKPL
jgi:hypothetical protein